MVLEETRSMRNRDQSYGKPLNGERSVSTERPTVVELFHSLIPRSLACWYIDPSTSVETAEVHSSRTANFGR